MKTKVIFEMNDIDLTISASKIMREIKMACKELGYTPINCNVSFETKITEES